MPAEKNSSPIVLAYSGGLDTSFLVPWLKENYGRPIITVTVDTGGIDAAGAKTLAGAFEGATAPSSITRSTRARTTSSRCCASSSWATCGAASSIRCAWAPSASCRRRQIALMARKLGTNSIAHGCTAAGNDQVRFEVAMRTLAPELEVIAPVRDKAFKRQEELDYLKARKLPMPPYGAAYSINRGLWGVTIGGKETLTSEGSIPDSAWVLSKDAFTNPRAPAKHTIHFEKGRPVGIDGKTMSAVDVVEKLETLGAPYGIGRGIHLGDTIIGTKGRVAFEAPAAETLLTAHRELEKLVLTPRQQRIKESLAGPYGDWVHEGQLLDPVCRDIEALFAVVAGARHGQGARAVPAG